MINEPNANTTQEVRTQKPTPNQRVAIECFPWLRSSSRSHTAMLMQLSEQSMANRNAAEGIADLPPMNVVPENVESARSVPAANKDPTVISLSGIVSHN